MWNTSLRFYSKTLWLEAYVHMCVLLYVCKQKTDLVKATRHWEWQISRQRIFKNNIVMQQINVSDAQNRLNFTLQIWKNE